MYYKKLIIFLVIIFVSFSNVVALAGSSTKIISFKSQKELNRDSITKRRTQFYNTQNEIKYLEKMYSLAVKKDSVALQGFIISNIIKNYYNRSEADSVELWFRRLEKIALDNRLYTEYFNSFNLYCAINLYQQKYEQAIEGANQLYLHAKELNNTDGLIASYENSGNIYIETYRYVEAVKAFNEGLNLLKKSEKRRYGYEFQFTTYLIESYLKLRDYNNAKISIENAQKILSTWKSKKNDIPYDRCAWLIDCYYIAMYVGLNQPQNAEKYVESSKQYVDKVNDFYVYYYYYYTCALYYQLTKNYSEAIDNIDKVLSIFIYQPALHLKGKILLESGRYKEAAIAYDFALNELDSTYSESFSKQINQLRSIHEFDKLEIKNKELELASRTLKLKIAIASAIVLLAIIIIGVLYIIRIRKIRNKLRISDSLLKEDKRMLIQSEQELKAEKEKVEKSSHFKDVFLANMNHEVRTPLNAIVGFSSILTDIYKDDSTSEYVNIIKYNSELLLKLINDTIDASSLQTGLLPFNYEQVELKSICQSIAQEFGEKVKDGVSLHVETNCKSDYYLKTDVLRLSQLLGNLLLNSIKFTDSGNIFLKFNVDEENKQVIFTVEDTGAGIPEEMQNIIFESFSKVDEFKQGLGLGLTLVKLISINLGGKTIVDPSYKTGTRINFIHPIN